MKSNVCKIDKGTKDLAAILAECEKVAVYNDLSRKQTLHLRLLCEELDGMLPELIGDFEGKFWIEFEDGVCKVNTSIEIADLSLENKKQLIAVAKDKKNSKAVGVVGKIRSAVENFFLDQDLVESLALSSGALTAATGCYVDMDYTHHWSLNQYRMSVKDQKEASAWDELEKSVIATVADDVVIGIKGSRADIIIIKKFT